MFKKNQNNEEHCYSPCLGHKGKFKGKTKAQINDKNRKQNALIKKNNSHFFTNEHKTPYC